MDNTTYYHDHWADVDEERLANYQQLFQWHPAMEVLISGADIRPGQVIVDYGCGPGGLAVELAARVGDKGHLHGVDLNEAFIALAREKLAANGAAAWSRLHHVTDDNIPLRDATADRLISKNVLEYVADYPSVVREFHRVVKAGGIVHIIDSDWGMIAVEPLGQDKLNELLTAASCAYKTPLIGRLLYSEMKRAGFSQVDINIIASADTRGRLLPVLKNFLRYAEAGGMAHARARELLDDITTSIAEETFMMVLPQFLITAQK